MDQKLADSAVGVSWFAWLLTWFLHEIEVINSVLQFFALLFAIAASVCAIRYHSKKR